MEAQDEEGHPRPKRFKRLLQEAALSSPQKTSVEVSLANTSENFMGGKIKHSLSNWKHVTNDKHVLDIVCGKVIPSEATPHQRSIQAEIPSVP